MIERRRDDCYIGRIILSIELPGKSKRGRLKSTFMCVVRENVPVVSVTEGDT